MKVPNKVLKAISGMIEVLETSAFEGAVSTDDLKLVKTWASEGSTKRAAMAAAPRSTNVAD